MVVLVVLVVVVRPEQAERLATAALQHLPRAIPAVVLLVVSTLPVVVVEPEVSVKQ
jgi:hypothetical protein